MKVQRGCCRQRGPIGWVCLQWERVGGRLRIVSLQLPPDSQRQRAAGRDAEAEALLRDLLRDGRASTTALAALPLEEGFAARVAHALVTAVGPGRAITYGRLAELAGSPGAARAVGTAMRCNDFPLLVPCHRVVAAGGRLGGFQGGEAGGSERKRALLEAEGVRFTGGGRVHPDCLV